MANALVALVSAILFGFGLGLARLLDPGQILAFLDVTGDWNPGPLIVMVAAIVVYAIGYRLVSRRQTPFAATTWHVPTARTINQSLIGGSALFGLGWGLAGYCPGPAIAALAFGKPETIYFFVAMIGGATIFQLVHERRGKRAKRQSLRQNKQNKPVYSGG